MASSTVASLAPTGTMSAGASGTPTPSGAPNQAGILAGSNPDHYNPKEPLVIFIIQAGIIIIFCRLLHYPLSRLRQPRVIAEVIGGIILGPTVMGRIPGFSKAIFPTESMPNLNLAANIGLVLFLFLVGLEVDLRFLTHNWKIALGVGALGMMLPFGLGIAIAYGLYNNFPTLVPVNFGVYLLFVGVAMAITAFPVLCRILTELKLLRTSVGVVVLSAGVGNDVVGWVLLALCVALTNAGTGLTALYVLLVAVGYTAFLFLAVKPAFHWVLRRTGSLQNGPSQGIIALTLLLVFASSFFTSIIGVHAIFGAFMVGLMCPHEGGFAIKVTEKVEDLVSALFLPLYFALSGLSTNLGLLNDGMTWGYTIGILAIAFFGKVAGGTLAARVGGLVWRESFTIGALMSCKGLVELIVLNIGLQAGILTPKTFSMFVVMALVTTFATTPLVSWLYPPWYQTKLDAWKRGEIDWEGNRIRRDSAGTTDDESVSKPHLPRPEVHRLLAHLRLDSMSGVLALVSLLAKPAAAAPALVHPSKKAANPPADDGDAQALDGPRKRPFQVHGVRLTELTERTSAVMRVTELEEGGQRDPVLNTFRTFGQLSNVAVSGVAWLGPPSAYAATLAQRARDVDADLMLLPWSETGAMAEAPGAPGEDVSLGARYATGPFTHFVQGALQARACPVAVFVDNGFGSKRRRAAPSAATPRGAALARTRSALSAHSLHGGEDDATVPLLDQSHHLFLPYFGSDDDRLALRLVLQLAQDPRVTATVVHFDLPEHARASLVAPTPGPGTPAVEAGDPLVAAAGASAASPRPSSSHEQAEGTDHARPLTLALPPRTPKSPPGLSQTVTPLALPPAAEAAAAFAAAQEALPAALAQRVVFETAVGDTEAVAPVPAAVARAARELGQHPKNAGDLLVVGRNEGLLRALGGAEAGAEPAWADGEAGRALGLLVGGLVGCGTSASYLVCKAGRSSEKVG